MAAAATLVRRESFVVTAVLLALFLVAGVGLFATASHGAAPPDPCVRVRDWAVQRVVLERYTLDQARALVPTCQ